MERYFELGIYNGEKSDGTGVCGKYKSFHRRDHVLFLTLNDINLVSRII